MLNDPRFVLPTERSPHFNPQQDTHFFIKIGDRYKKLLWSEVVYLRADNRYTNLFSAADKQEYPIRCTLVKTLNELLPIKLRGEFVQVNRGEAVQLQYITEFSGTEVKTEFNKMCLSEGGNKLLRSKVVFFA